MIPDAKIAYPALRDSASYIFEDGTLSNFVCRMIATMTPYIATASQKITLWQEKEKNEEQMLGHSIVPAWKSEPKVL